MNIERNDQILFIGDSITDAGRDRYTRLNLGSGYPQLIACYLMATYPSHNLKFYNRGLSGDTIFDMSKRFKKDCLDLEVDCVSILIGINDVWVNRSNNSSLSEGYFERFRNEYIKLLEKIKDKKIIIMSPFVLPYPKDRIDWRSDVTGLVEISKEIAQTYQATFIDLDQILNNLAQKHSPQYYTGCDGIHPTEAGQGVIAKAWLDAVDIV